MNYYIVSPLLNAISSIIICCVVLFHNPRSKLNRSFAYFSFSVFFWSICYYFWQISNDSNTALFWSRGLMLGAIVIPSSFFHFVIVLLSQDKKYRNILKMGYLISLFFVIADFTHLFVEKVSKKLFFQYWPIPGILYFPYLIFFSGFVLYGHILMVRKMRVEGAIEIKKQIQYVLLGTSLGFIGGVTNFLLWYDIPIPPIGNIFVSIYVLLVGYAIVAHHLMDIYIFIKKSTIIIIGGLIPVVLFFFLTLFSQEYLMEKLGKVWWVIPTVVGAILLFLVYKIINYALHIKEKEIKETQVKLRKLLLNLDDVNTLKEALIYR